MKKTLLLLILSAFIATGYAQEKPNIYDPSADASADISTALKMAKKTNRNVLLMIGGNWCPWCIRLNGFIHDDPKIDSTLRSNYALVKVNYSKENKNLGLLADLEYPQRMGFPVLVVLDQQGKRIHTQNSWYLEKEKSYDRDKLINFLKEWGPAALDPSLYKDGR